MISPFTWYANYYSTVNNEEGVGLFCQCYKRTDGQTDRRPTLFWNLVIRITMVHYTQWLLKKKPTVSKKIRLHSKLWDITKSFSKRNTIWNLTQTLSQTFSIFFDISRIMRWQYIGKFMIANKSIKICCRWYAYW